MVDKNWQTNEVKCSITVKVQALAGAMTLRCAMLACRRMIKDVYWRLILPHAWPRHKQVAAFAALLLDKKFWTHLDPR